ncbi:hypothetical protein [Kitasatospora sp. NPDC097643]|uniref:hypothetical protein n=1 Tax=Kitasatospora sp. NPDC097643 TaxID=3157230 RepID=UPI00332EC6C3
MDDQQLYLLWHARHLVVEDDGSTRHRDPDGELHLDEEEWRLLGVFHDEATAAAHLATARTLPGFRDEPDCFRISPLLPDEDHWTEGYITVVH